jgi:hypothetical protein
VSFLSTLTGKTENQIKADGRYQLMLENFLRSKVEETQFN